LSEALGLFVICFTGEKKEIDSLLFHLDALAKRKGRWRGRASHTERGRETRLPIRASEWDAA